MNSLPHDHDDRQHRLDLLVDGELSDAQRRQLLSTLDDQPEGWRQCALAFLEAQSWGQDLSAMARPASAAASSLQPQPTARPQPWWRSHHLGTLLALAASVVLCFGLGFRTHDWWQAGTRGGFAGNAPPQGFQSVAGGSLAGGARAGRPLPTPIGRASLDGPIFNGAMDRVTLVLDDDQTADAATVEIPIVRQRSSTGNSFNASAAVPANVLSALERLGSRVRQHQQLIPVRLNDGREAIVPVNRIELEPVNLRNYQ